MIDNFLYLAKAGFELFAVRQLKQTAIHGSIKGLINFGVLEFMRHIQRSMHAFDLSDGLIQIVMKETDYSVETQDEFLEDFGSVGLSDNELNNILIKARQNSDV